MADAVSILAQGVLAEAKHLFYLIILRYGSVLRKIFIWDQFQDETTFRRGHHDVQLAQTAARLLLHQKPGINR